MDNLPAYKALKRNREILKGFISEFIKTPARYGITRIEAIDYYISLLQEMKQEKLFDEVVK
jgi:hypothetical protein